jgi:plasmid stability protein
MEAEVRKILRNALRRDEEAAPVGFGTATVALFSGSGVYLDKPIEEIRGMWMRFRTLIKDRSRHQRHF